MTKEQYEEKLAELERQIEELKKELITTDWKNSKIRRKR